MLNAYWSIAQRMTDSDAPLSSLKHSNDEHSYPFQEQSKVVLEARPTTSWTSQLIPLATTLQRFNNHQRHPCYQKRGNQETQRSFESTISCSWGCWMLHPPELLRLLLAAEISTPVVADINFLDWHTICHKQICQLMDSPIILWACDLHHSKIFASKWSSL